MAAFRLEEILNSDPEDIVEEIAKDEKLADSLIQYLPMILEGISLALEDKGRDISELVPRIDDFLVRYGLKLVTADEGISPEDYDWEEEKARTFSSTLLENTDLEWKIRKLKEENRTDELTKLHSKSYASKRILDTLKSNSSVKRQTDVRNPLVVFGFFDLDGFKRMNDVYGHSFGNIVLREVAHRLHDTFRLKDYQDTIGRWGGDEFLFAYKTGDNIESIFEPINRMIEALTSEPYVSGSIEEKLDGISLGLVLATNPFYPDCPKEIERLVGVADMASAIAKYSRSHTKPFIAIDSPPTDETSELFDKRTYQIFSEDYLKNLVLSHTDISSLVQTLRGPLQSEIHRRNGRRYQPLRRGREDIDSFSMAGTTDEIMSRLKEVYGERRRG